MNFFKRKQEPAQVAQVEEQKMNITIVSTGRTFYEFPSDVAAALIECGLAKQVVKDKPQTPQPQMPTFGIGANLDGDATIVLRMPDGSVSQYDGPAEHARDAFKVLRWSASEQRRTLQGPEPTTEVLTAYESAKRAEEERAEQRDRERQSRRR